MNRAPLCLCCLAVAGALLSACEGAPDRPDDAAHVPRGFDQTDSAGVRILTSRFALQSLAAGSTQRAAQVWRTGWRDREPGFTRVHSGYLLEGGGAVVADGGKGLVYVFSDRGRVEVVFKPSVKGPDDFRNLARVTHLPPDSILVTDAITRHGYVFSRHGDFARSFSLPQVEPYAFIPDGVADGHIIYLPYWAHSPMHPYWKWVDLQTVTSGLEGESPVAHDMIPRDRSEERGPRFPSPIPDHGILGAFSAGYVWASRMDTDVHWYRPDGTPYQVFRERSSRYDGGLSVFSRLIVGQDGSVWRSESFPHDRFVVVRPNGVTTRTVIVPGGFTVLAATGDRILGVWKDDLGVEAVAELRVGGRARPDWLEDVLSWWLD